jgi:hypothetical protein
MANPVGAISNVPRVNPTTQPRSGKTACKRGEDHSARQRQHQCGRKGSQPDQSIEAVHRCGPRRRQQVSRDHLAHYIPSLIGA